MHQPCHCHLNKRKTRRTMASRNTGRGRAAFFTGCRPHYGTWRRAAFFTGCRSHYWTGAGRLFLRAVARITGRGGERLFLRAVARITGRWRRAAFFTGCRPHYGTGWRAAFFTGCRPHYGTGASGFFYGLSPALRDMAGGGGIAGARWHRAIRDRWVAVSLPGAKLGCVMT